ncbi:hypothetical protein VHEMI01954 [[Torrubiella] hemipterigena]|uniref:Probable transporter MCH1 n=1 Tax=[Torrubiella] hemipterigena TaxID=1531966 RepID=A0A0A1T6S1_9HYPO|nr:hypothetical protein VHEMI01954 [[Torrubiella] hemipterigena]
MSHADSRPPPESAVGQRRDDDIDNNDAYSSYTMSSADDGSDSDISLRRRQNQKKKYLRAVSLLVATIVSLCAGSISVFSLYGPRFQSRLRYTQFQVNGVAIASSLALYLPISIMGYFCDRVGAPPLAGFAGCLFAFGYGLAAWVYNKLDIEYNLLGKPPARGNEATYPVMLFAFVCIGAGTCAMYIAAVSTSAKNFGKGKYRGLALALPITGFGLSGMWVSQFASRFLYETRPDGSRGEVNVARFFVFLGVLLFVMGVIGVFTLRVVDEDDLIDEAIEELEQSGLLNGSTILGRGDGVGYGTGSARASLTRNSSFLGSISEDDPRWKKNWVLNAETRRFLADHTMWPFALAFLLMVGPGEAFINNLGTIIGTLSPPSAEGYGTETSSATHVSIFGVTSTLSRILIGTITDIIAPSPHTQHPQLSSSQVLPQQQRFTISRVSFMLFFAGLMSFGFAFLAAGAAQNHADRFWVVSGLVGAGYGAIFSLAPLMVTIIWGVENFATNFGIVTTLPALGSTFWGLVYSAVYQAGASQSDAANGGPDEDDIFCYGKKCYSSTFWGETITVWIACALLLFAWRGKGGWKQRGVVI